MRISMDKLKKSIRFQGRLVRYLSLPTTTEHYLDQLFRSGFEFICFNVLLTMASTRLVQYSVICEIRKKS